MADLEPIPLTPQQKYVAVHCGKCGRRFRARKWQEGLVCPSCHSGEVRPLVAPGGAVDYYVADRSRGYTAADVRFAQWAKWCEAITPRQYDLAFFKLNRLAQEGSSVPPIHDLMVAEGFLDKDAAVKLLEFLGLPRPSEQDRTFAKALMMTGAVDPSKVEEARQLQAKAAGKYHEVPPLCQLVLERHLLTEGQMLALLRKQEEAGHGTLRTARQAVAKPAQETAAATLTKAASLRNPRNRKLAIILACFLLGLGMWAWHVSASRVWMYVQCERCTAISRVEWSKTFPVRCPRCEKEYAYYLVVCENGHQFTVNSPYVSEPCPRCGTFTIREFTKDDLSK